MKKALTLFLALVMVLLLSACGSEAKELDNPNGYNSIKFAMAVNGTDTQIDTRVANKFKELVEEASGASSPWTCSLTTSSRAETRPRASR